MTTIAATIVSTLDSALTDSTGFAVRTLAELGLRAHGDHAAGQRRRAAASFAGSPVPRCRSAGGLIRGGTAFATTSRHPDRAAAGRAPQRRRSPSRRATACSGALCGLALVLGGRAHRLDGRGRGGARRCRTGTGRCSPRPAQGRVGGLLNAILGTCVLVVGVLLVAGTVSVLTGVYLSEFCAAVGCAASCAARTRCSPASRRSCSGYVGYIALVVHFHWGFSLLAGRPHAVDHHDPVHRQGDRERARAGARRPTARAPRRSASRPAGPCGASSLKSAAAGHRHRAARRPCDRRRGDGAAALHRGLVGHPAVPARCRTRRSPTSPIRCGRSTTSRRPRRSSCPTTRRRC